MSCSLYNKFIETSPDGGVITPEIVLSCRSGEKQGILVNVSSFNLQLNLSDTDEISFDVYKEIDGITCDLWEDIKDFKLIYIPQFVSTDYDPWYELNVTIDEENSIVKHCEAIHLQEAELGQLTLNNIEINTESDILNDDYVVTTIYNKDNPKGSLLNRILSDKASHYTIEFVDDGLQNIQRTFSWNGSTIKEALDDISEEIEALFVYGWHKSSDYGEIHRTISLYDLKDYCIDCGTRGIFEDGVCAKCGSENIRHRFGKDSGLFVNKENFSSKISYSTNKDSVKNCFRLVGGDDLMTATIKNLNPNGSQYLWYLSDDVRKDMSDSLRTLLDQYDEKYKELRDTADTGLSSVMINSFNNLVNKYKYYDDTLIEVSNPVCGYVNLISMYYQALNLYNLLKTSLAPASFIGKPISVSDAIDILESHKPDKIGVLTTETISSTSAKNAVERYVKTYVDTSLFKVTVTTESFNNSVWTGHVSLSSYDDNERSSTSVWSVTISKENAEYIKTQIDKVLTNTTGNPAGIVDLFRLNDDDFKEQLKLYSADNLEILSKSASGCLNVLIEQGVADKSVSDYAELYNTLYLPYYRKKNYIEDELVVREKEIKRIRHKETQGGILDRIEALRDIITKKLDIRTFLGEEAWAELCSFRREQEYKNDNFISDGLTDTELIDMAQQFYDRAYEELIKSATLQHTISCDLNNLLLVSEDEIYTDKSKLLEVGYAELLNNFSIGNWIHIEVDENVYLLRMIGCRINYDEIENLDVEFSDNIKEMNSVSDVQSILSKSNSMATSYNTTMKQADKGNIAHSQISDIAKSGLSLTNKKIFSGIDSQNIVWDDNGILLREKNDFSGEYGLEQTRIINSGIYFTDDGWETAKAGLGSFTYLNPETGEYENGYGVIADKLVGNIILSNEVGVYNSYGSIKLDENGLTITSDASNETNDTLFKLRRKNLDGNYTDYMSVTSDGELIIQGSSVDFHANLLTDTYDMSRWKMNKKIAGEGFPSSFSDKYDSCELSDDDYYKFSTTRTKNYSALRSPNISIEENTDYTFSVYIKGEPTFIMGYLEYSSTGGWVVKDEVEYDEIPDGFYKITFNSGEHNVVYFAFEFSDISPIYIKFPKLEKGVMATDWCPAQSDEIKSYKNSTNYLKFSESSGLIIGNIIDDTLSSNVNITSDSVKIRNGDTIKASFGETILLGEENSWQLELTPSQVSMFKKSSDSSERVFYVDGTSSDMILGRYQSTDSSNNGNIYLKNSSTGSEIMIRQGETTYAKFSQSGMILYDDDGDEIVKMGQTISIGKRKPGDYYGLFELLDTYHTIQLLVKKSASSLDEYDDIRSALTLDTDYAELYGGTNASIHVGNNEINLIGGTAINTSNRINIGTAHSPSSETFGAGFIMTGRWSDYENHTCMYIDSTGTHFGVGWNGKNSDNKLIVNTSTYLKGNSVYVMDSSGTASISDKRLKKDFTDLDNWDEFFDALNPCAYKYKSGATGRYHIGFIAQEVEEALNIASLSTHDFGGIIKSPYSADPENEGDIKFHEEVGINVGDDEYSLIYTEFIALNTYEIKKLKKENCELKSIITNLESRIEVLESK